MVLKTDRTNIKRSEMPLNGERAYELMQSRGVDAIVASSTENVYYVSDYWSIGKQLGCGVEAYALLPMDSEPALVAPLREADLVVDSRSWIGDLRFYGSSNLQLGKTEDPSEQTEHLLKIHKSAGSEADGTTALVKTLEEKKLTGETIALDASNMPPGLFDYIKGRMLDAKIVDGSSLLSEIRLMKTGPEIDCIRRATEITEKSMEDALEIARSEIMEIDLAGMFAYSVAYDGGRVSQDMIGFRERSAFPNPVPSELEAARGDLIRMTLGCRWLHYHSNISRTAVIGRAPAKVKKIWEAVQNAQDAALEAIRPGARLSEVYAAAGKEMDSTGVRGSLSFGHGLGVECNERPWIEAGSDGELLEGMVLNVDIPYLELGWGGVQLEDTVLVTKDGFELLTNTDRTLYLL
jgi:Xaa-Pro dipeptidase